MKTLYYTERTEYAATCDNTASRIRNESKGCKFINLPECDP